MLDLLFPIIIINVPTENMLSAFDVYALSRPCVKYNHINLCTHTTQTCVHSLYIDGKSRENHIKSMSSAELALLLIQIQFRKDNINDTAFN